MAAGFEERAQSRYGARNGIGPHDAESIEAMSARHVGKRTLGRGRRQKSRLA
jgi:hypothetical protein